MLCYIYSRFVFFSSWFWFSILCGKAKSVWNLIKKRRMKQKTYALRERDVQLFRNALRDFKAGLIAPYVRAHDSGSHTYIVVMQHSCWFVAMLKNTIIKWIFFTAADVVVIRVIIYICVFFVCCGCSLAFSLIWHWNRTIFATTN